MFVVKTTAYGLLGTGGPLEMTSVPPSGVASRLLGVRGHRALPHYTLPVSSQPSLIIRSLLLLTPTTVAGVKRSSASVCVCLSVCSITQKRMIPK